MIIIKIGGVIADIEDYVWHCEDTQLLAALNAVLPSEGASGLDPHPDLTVAQAAVAAYGGEVLQADDADYEEGAVY